MTIKKIPTFNVGDYIEVAGLFIVECTDKDTFRLVWDYDISPTSQYWTEFEPSANILTRPLEDLKVISPSDYRIML